MNPSQLAALDILTPIQREYVIALRQELQDKDKTDVFGLNMTDLESPQTVKSCQPRQREMADEAIESSKNVVVLDEKGRVILVYRRNHLLDPVVRSAEAAIEKLLKNVNLKLPPDDDRRSNIDKQDLIKKYGDGRFGVLYCAYWMEQGNAANGPMICREMAKGSTRLGDYCRFVRDMKQTKERLSLLYAAADPLRWRQCINIFDALCYFKPDAQLLAASKIDPWTSLVLVANVPTDVHRDLNDARHMLSGIASSGTFPSSWLVIHSGGFKMRIKPEHGILLNTHILAHFVDSREPDDEKLEPDQAKEPRTEEFKSNEQELNSDEGYQAPDQYILSFFNHQKVQDWVRSQAQSGER